METEAIVGAHESAGHVASFVKSGVDPMMPGNDASEGTMLVEGRFGTDRDFKIRAADEGGHRSSANILIERRYAWRGLQNATLPQAQTSSRITFSAVEGDSAIGTITVAFDEAREPVVAEEVFPEEVRALRAEGKKICEFTKLAMDPVDGSRRVLASLFHVAFLVAHRLRKYDTLLLEVVPRHVAYYRRMLGCKVLGPERMHTRVHKPVVLLGIDFAYIRQQIDTFASHPEMATMERSLYPYAFSSQEEEGILGRMQASLGSLISGNLH